MKVQLSAAEEQCQTLQEDLECTEMSKDTLIQKAWDARDSAVKVKKHVFKKIEPIHAKCWLFLGCFLHLSIHKYQYYPKFNLF